MAILRVTQGQFPGRRISLPRGTHILGRDARRSDIVLDHEAVSRRHARLEVTDEGVFLEDLDSHNGTRVNGRRLPPGPAGRRRLEDQDVVDICGTNLVFCTADDESSSVKLVTESWLQDIRSTVNVAHDPTLGRRRDVRDDRLGCLLAVVERMRQAWHLDDVLPEVLDELIAAFPPARCGFVLLNDPDSKDLTPRAARCRNGQPVQITASRELIDAACARKHAILSSEARTEPAAARPDPHTVMCAPLLDSGGEVLGVLQLDARNGSRPFGSRDLDVFSGAARLIAVCIENSRLHESRLQRQRLRLEEQFQQLVEGSLQGILLHRDERPLYVNRAWADFHGCTTDEVMRLTNLSDLVAPDDRARLRRFHRLRLQGKAESAEIEFRGLHRDGSQRWFISLVTVAQWNGLPALQSAMIDVTERRIAESALQRAHSELEHRVDARTRELAEANRRLREEVAERIAAEKEKQRYAEDLERSNCELEEFASVASHDLQSPLRSVAGYCQLLKQRYGGQLDPQAGELLDAAVQGAERMQQLVRKLLDYSRINSGSWESQPVETERPVQTALANLSAAVNEAHASVTWQSLPTVLGDETQLVRLFQNLIGNAIKHRGNQPPRIDISSYRDGPFWQLRIRDNGVGIEPRDRDRAFVIFQRLAADRPSDGSGVGLAICKRIVQRHGGQIWIEDNPAGGTVFCFTLPAADAFQAGP